MAAIQHASARVVHPFHLIFQRVEAVIAHATRVPARQRPSGNSTSHCGLIAQDLERHAFPSWKEMDHRAAGSDALSAGIARP
jgi:hypothetical protein